MIIDDKDDEDVNIEDQLSINYQLLIVEDCYSLKK